MFPGLHLNSSGELLLMNSMDGDLGLIYPMFGGVTELEVWSRPLTAHTVTQWTSCHTEDRGDVLTWDSARLRVTGLSVVEVEMSQVCGQQTQQYVTIQTRTTFDESRRLCLAVGGLMAVAEDEETLEEMVTSFRSTNCSRGFFSGHTDRETEGVWRREGRGREVSQLRWRPGQPDDHLGVEDCAFYSLDTGDYVDHACSRTFCPVCKGRFQ